MRRLTIQAVAIAATLGLAACASPRPETRVTRFHLQQPIAPGQIAIEGRTPAMNSSLEFQSYAAAVGAELRRLGFTVAPGVSRSELVATIDVNRGTRAGLAQRSPVSIGLGGGGFSGGGYGGGVGLGGGISFPIGKSRSRDISVTELFVQIKRRSDGTLIWEGRAQQDARADTPAADPVASVAALARELFRDFPGESGRTITTR